MEKGKKYYDYIKALLYLYDEYKFYVFENYAEAALIIKGECGNYKLYLGERGLVSYLDEAKTPNEIVYKTLFQGGRNYLVDSYEVIRDKILERNIDYVEELLKDKEFQELVLKLKKENSNDKLKDLALEHLAKLTDEKLINSYSKDNLRLLLAYFFAKGPKKHLQYFDEVISNPEFIKKMNEWNNDFESQEEKEKYLHYKVWYALVQCENENISSEELKEILEYVYETYYYEKDKVKLKLKEN